MQLRFRYQDDDSFDNMSETFSEYLYKLNEDARRQEQLEDARRQEQLENDRRQEQLRQQHPQEHYQEMIEQPQLRIINLMDLYAVPYADDQVLLPAAVQMADQA